MGCELVRVGAYKSVTNRGSYKNTIDRPVRSGGFVELTRGENDLEGHTYRLLFRLVWNFTSGLTETKESRLNSRYWRRRAVYRCKKGVSKVRVNPLVVESHEVIQVEP